MADQKKRRAPLLDKLETGSLVGSRPNAQNQDRFSAERIYNDVNKFVGDVMRFMIDAFNEVFEMNIGKKKGKKRKFF